MFHIISVNVAKRRVLKARQALDVSLAKKPSIIDKYADFGSKVQTLRFFLCWVFLDNPSFCIANSHCT